MSPLLTATQVAAAGRGRLLLVEDNPGDADLVRERLLAVTEKVPVLHVVATLDAALKCLGSDGYEAVLLDLNLPDSTGLATLDRVVAVAEFTPVIVLTGAGGDDLGVEALARGAADFLPKDELTGRLLLRSVRYAVERTHRRSVESRYRALVENSRDLVAILGPDLTVHYVSPSVRRILGFEVEDTMGANVARAVHPDDRRLLELQVGRLLADRGYLARFTYRMRHHDGGWRLLDTIAQNCFDDPHIRGLVVNARDVTDLQEAEEAAIGTARRLEHTLGALADAVFTVETDSRTIEGCNPAAVSMFGYSREEILDHSTRILHTSDESFREFAEESLPVLRRGESFRREYRMRRKDGETFPADITVSLLHPERGLEGGVVSVVRDISERVQHAREMRFQAALLQQVGQPVMAVDEDGRVTYWNPAVAKLSGWSREEMEGRQVIDLLVHEDDRDVALFARESARAGQQWEGELRLRKKDGGVVVLQVTATRGVQPDGSRGGRIAAGVDITELRRAEQASRRAAERVQLQADMLEAVGQAVIATDLDGTVTYWNRAAEELYGWSRDEALGRSVLDVTPNQGNRRMAEESIERLQAGETWTGEFPLQRRDGTTFPAFVTDAPIKDEQGGLVGIIGVSSDITERKELEEQLRQTQKMEAIGRLAGGVAHDFNNLLTAIDGHATLLRDELEEDSPLRNDADEILRAGERAAALTRQLLAFSRKQLLEERHVELAGVTLELNSMLRRLVPERIDFSMEAVSESPVVRADPGQLQQVVMNLVVNAVDAIEDGGAIEVTVDGTTLSQEDVDDIPWRAEPGPYGRLTVLDTGSGIPDDVMEHIFEPFFTTKSEGRGTGLGLATVYGIVKQTGGHVFIETAPGAGTTFQVLIPRVAAEPDHPMDEERLALPMAGPDPVRRVVLLVEDDSAVRGIARRILDRGGYEVVEATDGREALHVVEERDAPVDLVISDVVMPEIGGVELQKELVATNPQLKMILTSGYSEAEVKGEIRELDAVFLPKPFTPRDLLECVDRALSSSAEDRR